jgi:hypothetical protein
MKWIAVLMLIVGCVEARGSSASERDVEARGSSASERKGQAHEAALEKKVVPRVPLGEQLAREAAARPARAVRAEQLVAALAQRGVQVARPHQVLASPVDARYCELMTTAGGLAISLCEYGDAAAAQRGRAQSQATFDALLPGRTLDTRFNTLLTLTPAADRELVRQTFAELEPS